MEGEDDTQQQNQCSFLYDLKESAKAEYEKLKDESADELKARVESIWQGKVKRHLRELCLAESVITSVALDLSRSGLTIFDKEVVDKAIAEGECEKKILQYWTQELQKADTKVVLFEPQISTPVLFREIKVADEKENK